MHRERFADRGDTDYHDSHPLFQDEHETVSNYVDRLVSFWEKRFASFGYVYLLPHHAMSEFSQTKSMINLLNEGISYELLRDYLVDTTARGIQKGLMSQNDTPISSIFPITSAVEGDFDVPYNQDVFGKNMMHIAETSYSHIAMYLAVAKSVQPIRVGCHSPYDPYCFVARVFGRGTHCVASSINNFAQASRGIAEGDIKLLQKFISAVEELSLAEEGVKVEKSNHIINASVTFPKSFFDSDQCSGLINRLYSY